MARVRVSLRDGAVDIDLCRHCTLLWFDPGELERFPEVSRSRRYDEEVKASNRQRSEEARRASIAALTPILSQYPTDAWLAVLNEAIREWSKQ